MLEFIKKLINTKKVLIYQTFLSNIKYKNKVTDNILLKENITNTIEINQKIRN